MRELTSKEEQALLSGFAETCNNVLEIGSYDGASAIAMAKVVRGNVHCVDAFIEDNAGTKGKVYPSPYQFMKNTAEYSNIVLHVGKTLDILPWFRDESFDMVFVDGAHHYSAAFFDLTWASRLARRGGLIAVHDIHWPDVARAIKETLRPMGLDTVGSLGVWRN